MLEELNLGSGSLQVHSPTLGHSSVPLLDKLTEFRRDVVEGLRQPFEDGRVVINPGGGIGGVPGAAQPACRFSHPISERCSDSCCSR